MRANKIMSTGTLDRPAGVRANVYHLRPEWDRFKKYKQYAKNSRNPSSGMYQTMDRSYSKPWIYNEEEKPH